MKISKLSFNAFDDRFYLIGLNSARASMVLSLHCIVAI